MSDMLEGRKILWSEDECTRGLDGHETIDDKWKELYNTNFREQWDEVKDTEKDYCDTFTRIMPNGVLVVLSFDGYSIYDKVDNHSV